jgi:hypothetical protein
VQVDFLGVKDWDAVPVPPVWSAPPPTAAALGLTDALRRQHLWITAANTTAGVGGGQEHGAPAQAELTPTSDEFRTVAAYFYASADPACYGLRRRIHVPAGAAGAGARQLRVESVQRVENCTLRALYLARRARVARQCGVCKAAFRVDAVRMERRVFHGPGNMAAHGDALECIVVSGPSSPDPASAPRTAKVCVIVCVIACVCACVCVHACVFVCVICVRVFV